MKNKIVFILLLININVLGQSVPNTETFTLQNVIDVVNPTTDDLRDCLKDAIAAYFDPAYNNSSYAPDSSLLRFRNYKPNCAGFDIVVYPSPYPNTHTVDLGANTGTVTLTFNPYSLPDMVLVYWNGALQINSGYVGSSLYGCDGIYRNTQFNSYLNGKADPLHVGYVYPNSFHSAECDDEYPGVTNTTQYVNTFSKSTSSSSCTVYVYPSNSSSRYSFTMSCPE